MVADALDGRVALVTGGTRGIGLGVVRAFLDEGASVALMGRDEATGARALEELDAGDRAIFVAGDVTRRADVEGAIDATVEQYGRLEILVNNAGGMTSVVPLTEVSDEQWEGALTWNLTSVFFGMRHAVRVMGPQGWGRIINMSSFRAKQPAPGQGPYSAAKAAVNALTKAMAMEVGDLGITVNAICPGAVLTDFSREAGAEYAAGSGLTVDELMDHYRRTVPARRLGTPEAMGALAVFFASDAAECISGACYSADGGAADY